MENYRSTLMLIFCLISINQLSSQNNYQAIIESDIVKDKIKFKIINKNLEFALDDGVFKPLPKEINLQGKSNITIFNSNYIHPLKYNISLENKLVEDELKKAVQEYLIELTTSLQSFSKSTPSLSGSRTFAGSSVESLVLKNKHLIELFAIINGFKNDFFNNDSSAEFLDAMKFVSNDKINEINQNYNQMFANLWDIKGYEEIDIAIKENKRLAKENEKKIKETNEKIEKLELESKKFIGSYLKLNETYLTLNITELIKLKVKDVNEDFEDFLKMKENLNTKYTKLEELFIAISNSTYKEKDKKETRIDLINFEEGKRNEITIYFKIYDYNTETKAITEKEHKEYKINIRKYQKLIPVVSSGVLYTNLTFNNFGTGTNDKDETIIEKGEDKDNEIAVGAYLNLYLNNGWQNPIFFQLGVGPSKEKPLLFGGLGINIASKLSLSVGAVFTWTPSLNELNVGDVISGTAEIENDITYKFTNTPKFYLGLSYNLSK